MTGARAPRSDHYSYRVYADPTMAESFDGLRFSGPIGQLIARTQEQVIAGFLDPIEGREVLDVGTGTGRAAIALAHRGARVTGIDASAEMLADCSLNGVTRNGAVFPSGVRVHRSVPVAGWRSR